MTRKFEIAFLSGLAAMTAGAALAAQNDGRRDDWDVSLEEEIELAVSHAHWAAEEARAHRARIDRNEIERIVRKALRTGEETRRAGMARGAEGMERGAEGMERGARRMAEEAARLRDDSAHRERQIVRAAERGETLTHEELIELADDLEESSREMIESAAGMRRSAQDMRRGG